MAFPKKKNLMKKKNKPSDVTKDSESEEQKDLSSKDQETDGDKPVFDKKKQNKKNPKDLDQEDDDIDNSDEEDLDKDPDDDNDDDSTEDGDKDKDFYTDKYDKGKFDNSNKSILALDKDKKGGNSQIKINPPLRDVYEQIVDMPIEMQEHAFDRLIEEYGAEAVLDESEEELYDILYAISEEEGIDPESLLEAIGAGEEGTDQLVYNYLSMIPGQCKKPLKIGDRYRYPENDSIALVARNIEYVRNFLNQKTRSSEKIGF